MSEVPGPYAATKVVDQAASAVSALIFQLSFATAVALGAGLAALALLLVSLVPGPLLATRDGEL
jgi:hypothetical protein